MRTLLSRNSRPSSIRCPSVCPSVRPSVAKMQKKASCGFRNVSDPLVLISRRSLNGLREETVVVWLGLMLDVVVTGGLP